MTTLPAFNTMSMKTIFFIEKSRINQTMLSNATTSSLIIIKLDKAYENGHSSILGSAQGKFILIALSNIKGSSVSAQCIQTLLGELNILFPILTFAKPGCDNALQRLQRFQHIMTLGLGKRFGLQLIITLGLG